MSIHYCQSAHCYKTLARFFFSSCTFPSGLGIHVSFQAHGLKRRQKMQKYMPRKVTVITTQIEVFTGGRKMFLFSSFYQGERQWAEKTKKGVESGEVGQEQKCGWKWHYGKTGRGNGHTCPLKSFLSWRHKQCRNVPYTVKLIHRQHPCNAAKILHFININRLAEMKKRIKEKKKAVEDGNF